MELPLILILGLVAPFLIALLNRVGWSSKTKQLMAFGVAILLAVIWILMTGGIAGFGFESIVAAVPAIYALSQLVYEFLFKNVISKLEAATDRNAVVVIPDVNAVNGVLVTSNETIKVSEVSDAPANVPASAPIEVTTTPEPRG